MAGNTSLRTLVIVILLGLAILYAVLVTFLGFVGAVAYTIHFTRVAAAVAVLFIFLPLTPQLFQEVPAPRRDYLLAGIILTWLSNILFSIWNQAGATFGVNTSIFGNPIAGFFSLLLVVGALFHFLAPGLQDRNTKVWAIALGLLVASAVVLVPIFFVGMRVR